jgi:hypothetical protein
MCISARMVQKPHLRGVEGQKDDELRAWHRNGAPTAGKTGPAQAFSRWTLCIYGAIGQSERTEKGRPSSGKWPLKRVQGPEGRMYCGETIQTGQMAVGSGPR